MPIRPNNLPATIYVDGHPFKSTVMQVLSVDIKGRPRDVRIVFPDDKTKIEDLGQFIVIYAAPQVLKAERRLKRPTLVK